MSFRIEPMHECHLDSAWDIEQECFSNAPIPDRLTRSDYAKFLTNSEYVCLRALNGELHIGSAIGQVRSSVGHICLIVIEPAYGNAGIGGKLLASLERMLMMRGCTKICAQTWPSNILSRTFFMANGHVEASTIDNFYGSGFPAINLQKAVSVVDTIVAWLGRS